MLTAAVCASTEELYNVETKTIAVDFGKSDIYSKIEEGLAGLEIGVLGKNATFELCLYVKEAVNGGKGEGGLISRA